MRRAPSICMSVRHPRRDELKKHLESQKIAVRCIIRCPCICRSAMRRWVNRAGDFPLAERRRSNA